MIKEKARSIKMRAFSNSSSCFQEMLLEKS